MAQDTYMATFHTHYGALSFFQAMESRGIPAKMMPVPRRLSSSCGTGVRFETGLEVAPLAVEDSDKIFLCQGADYVLVYENES